MIELGLARVGQLVKLLQYPLQWKAIHVAGTNGKGSVCAYISSGLHHSGLHCGRFTSPHLIDRWDCITLNDSPVSRSTFLDIEKDVLALNTQHGIGATEFELLTATAFEIFSRAKVDIAVIEVGVGGRLDATNVLEKDQVLVTAVTKVGMDHEALLGGTLEEIARQKAGIMKPGVPTVCDSTNHPDVLKIVRNVKEEIGAGEIRWPTFKAPVCQDGKLRFETKEFGIVMMKPPLHGKYQLQNAQLALEALSIASTTFPGITKERVVKGIEATRWPGRLDWIDLSPLVPALASKGDILLDGAHNPQAAWELRAYVEDLRNKGPSRRICWIFAATKGKNVLEILKILLSHGDTIFTVGFGDVDGMPWIKSTETAKIAETTKGWFGEDVEVKEYANEVEALEAASAIEGHIVVAGSLYLIGDLLRKLRDATRDDKS